MKEQELREHIRKEIKKTLAEKRDGFLGQVGSVVRGRLGSAKQQLARALGKIDTKKLAKLPKTAKVELLATLAKRFGIDLSDFKNIQQRDKRSLKPEKE